MSWKRQEETWNPSEKGQLLLDPPSDSPLPSVVMVANVVVVQGRRAISAWTVHGYTEAASARVLPFCLFDLAGWQISPALLLLT